MLIFSCLNLSETEWKYLIQREVSHTLTEVFLGQTVSSMLYPVSTTLCGDIIFKYICVLSFA